MNDSLINNRQISQKKNLSPFVNKKKALFSYIQAFYAHKVYFQASKLYIVYDIHVYFHLTLYIYKRDILQAVTAVTTDKLS